VFPAAFPQFASGEGNILDTLASCFADRFFGAVEMGPIADSKQRAEVAGFVKERGLGCVYLAGIPILRERLNLSAIDEAVRWSAVRRVVSMIDEAFQLGACLMLVSSGPDPGVHLRERALEQLAKSLSTICRCAEDYSVEAPLMITLEHYDRDIDKRFLLGPSAVTAEFVRALKSEHPNLGITLDQSHICQLGESPEMALGHLADLVAHVHLANCVISNPLSQLYGDQHVPFGIEEGECGDDEVHEFLRALMNSGYFSRPNSAGSAIVSLEVRPPAGTDPWTVLAQSKATFERAWMRLPERVTPTSTRLRI
jgi:sugar phosphate isomerase/epimerase